MEINIDEALRYLGVRQDPDGSVRRQMQALAHVVQERFPPRWVYRVFPLQHCEEGVMLEGSGAVLSGATAGTMLADCSRASVLVCTLGPAFDAHVRSVQARDMTAAVMLDALGSAWVEAGCDAAEDELRARLPGQYLTDRFSPGYGDLPLDVQPALLSAADAARRVGVLDTPSHLMNPQKSVTALIGVADRPQKARIRGCAFCSMRSTCPVRSGNGSCRA